MEVVIDQPPFLRKTLWERHVEVVEDPLAGPYNYASAARNVDGFDQVQIVLYWQETTVPYVAGHEALLGIEFGWDGAAWPIRREIVVAREIMGPRFEGPFEMYNWSWFVPVALPQMRLTFDWNYNGTGRLRLRSNLHP